MAVQTQTHTVLAADTNQALGIANYAIEFLEHGVPDAEVIERTELFHTDATLCGLSAIALGTNAPTVLRAEAITTPTEESVRRAMAIQLIINKELGLAKIAECNLNSRTG